VRFCRGKDLRRARDRDRSWLIIPGIRLSAESLFEKTALLPKVRVCKPASVIGKDTKGSILSGIFYGYGEMLKGLIDLLAQKLHARPKVIMTGGYASLMKAYMNKRVDVMDADLIFKGLALLACDSVTPRKISVRN
jgi:type III pantothenate kinase